MLIRPKKTFWLLGSVSSFSIVTYFIFPHYSFEFYDFCGSKFFIPSVRCKNKLVMHIFTSFHAVLFLCGIYELSNLYLNDIFQLAFLMSFVFIDARGNRSQNEYLNMIYETKA